MKSEPRFTPRILLKLGPNRLTERPLPLEILLATEFGCSPKRSRSAGSQALTTAEIARREKSELFMFTRMKAGIGLID
jgi:hypothetical protein